MTTSDDEHDQAIINQRVDACLALAHEIMGWHELNVDHLPQIKSKTLKTFIHKNQTSLMTDFKDGSQTVYFF